MKFIRYGMASLDLRISYTLRQKLLPVLYPGRYRRLVDMREDFGEFSIRPFVKQKAIYVHIPKTGGNSISTALFSGQGGGHSSIRDYEYTLRTPDLEGYKVISFVRNPWDRLVSAYLYLTQGGAGGKERQWAQSCLGPYPDFSRFIDHGLDKRGLYQYIHFYPQSYFLLLNGQLRVDYLGRFESIAEDFNRICQVFGIEASLGHRNASQRAIRDYRQWYTDRQAEKVRELYLDDIELFGYEFER